MILTYEPGFETNYAQLKYTHKGVDFHIIIEETLNDKDSHPSHVVFRTPKGKYKLDFYISPEVIKDLDEGQFKEMFCDMAYSSFESTHGWNQS